MKKLGKAQLDLKEPMGLDIKYAARCTYFMNMVVPLSAMPPKVNVLDLTIENIFDFEHVVRDDEFPDFWEEWKQVWKLKTEKKIKDTDGDNDSKDDPGPN